MPEKQTTAAVAPTSPSMELKDFDAKISYALGLQVGMNLKNAGQAIDLAIFMRAIKDMLEDKKPLLSEQEMDKVGNEFTKRMNAKTEKQNAEQTKMDAVVGEKNRKEGAAFLAENMKKPGVKTTASGLQYMVLTEGKGPRPTADDTVLAHYKGTLLDGTEFDSSIKRGQPAKFPLNRVIAGWTEGVQLMNVGSKFRFFIPSELAYRDRSMPPITPNSTLIFEVELMEIVK